MIVPAMKLAQAMVKGTMAARFQGPSPRKGHIFRGHTLQHYPQLPPKHATKNEFVGNVFICRFVWLSVDSGGPQGGSNCKAEPRAPDRTSGRCLRGRSFWRSTRLKLVEWKAANWLYCENVLLLQGHGCQNVTIRLYSFLFEDGVFVVENRHLFTENNLAARLTRYHGTFNIKHWKQIGNNSTMTGVKKGLFWFRFRQLIRQGFFFFTPEKIIQKTGTNNFYTLGGPKNFLCPDLPWKMRRPMAWRGRRACHVPALVRHINELLRKTLVAERWFCYMFQYISIMYFNFSLKTCV